MTGLNLMQLLFSADLDQLREEFQARPEGVGEEDFVLLLQRYCPELRRKENSSRYTRESESRLTSPGSNTSLHLGKQPLKSPLISFINDSSSADLGEKQRAEIHQLFHDIDWDGDGMVTWDEVSTFAISSTMQRLEPRPAERIRPYTRSKHVAREGNVHLVRHFNHHDLLCTSSRHNPIQLFEASTLKLVASAPLSHLDTDEIVMSVCHAPQADVIVAFTNALNLKTWGMSTHRLLPQSVLPCEEYLCHIAVPDSMPAVVFAGTSVGTLKLFDVSRHAEPRLRCTIPIHTSAESAIPGTIIVPGITGRRPISGDVMTTFTFIKPDEHRIVTTAHDQRICVTDLNVVASSGATEKSALDALHDRLIDEEDGSRKAHRAITCIGKCDSVVTHLDYNENYHVILAAGMNRALSAWAPHAAHSPTTALEDLLAPHTAQIVGLFSVPGTAQLVSTDRDGVMKVWDLRMFRCVQTLRIFKNDSTAENTDDTVTADDASASMAHTMWGGEVGSSDRRSICGSVYISSLRQIVNVDTRGFTCFSYDPSHDPTLADPHHVIGMMCNSSADTIITVTVASVGVWDVRDGSLAAHHNLQSAAIKADVTACCADRHFRRIILGFADGFVRVYGYHGLPLLKERRMNSRDITGVIFNDDTHTIYAASLDGSLSNWIESDTGASVVTHRLALGAITAMTHDTELSLIALGGATGRLQLVDFHHPRVSVGETEGIPASSVKHLAFIRTFSLFAATFVHGITRIYTCRPALEIVQVMSFDPCMRFRKLDLTSSVMIPQSPKHHMSAMNTDTLSSASSSLVVEDPVFVSYLAFDAATHLLWVAHSNGCITSWPLCPLLRALNLKTAAYPGTPMYPVDATLAKNVVLRSTHCFQAHKDEVLALELIPQFRAIVSSGEDRKVSLWSLDHAEPLGDLCFGRRGDHNALIAGDPIAESATLSSSVHYRRQGSRGLKKSTSPRDGAVIPPFRLTRSHPVPSPCYGSCPHSGSFALESAESTASKPAEPERSNSITAPLLLGDDSIISFTSPPELVTPRHTTNEHPRMIASARSTVQPLLQKPSSVRPRICRMHPSSKQPTCQQLSPRDVEVTREHLSTLLGHGTKAAAEERLQRQRTILLDMPQRQTAHPSGPEQMTSPAAILPHEPETSCNSPRQLSLAHQRESRNSARLFPNIPSIKAPSATLLTLGRFRHELAAATSCRPPSSSASNNKCTFPAPDAPVEAPVPSSLVASVSVFHIATVPQLDMQPPPERHGPIGRHPRVDASPMKPANETSSSTTRGDGSAQLRRRRLALGSVRLDHKADVTQSARRSHHDETIDALRKQLNRCLRGSNNRGTTHAIESPSLVRGARDGAL